jgi:hypothetical protein
MGWQSGISSGRSIVLVRGIFVCRDWALREHDMFVCTSNSLMFVVVAHWCAVVNSIQS